MEVIMSVDVDELLPTAQDLMKRLAQVQSEKADAAIRRQAEIEAEKKAAIERLTKASDVSDEEGIKRGMNLIRRAVEAGLTEVQVYRFPNVLCTDRGRAINQMERGWEETLTGVPKEIHQLWYRYFRPRGYKLSVQIIDFPDGMPGDIGMTFSWG
jgi:hypothetical protein